jgi:putative nucleotidyltransferase with HDIG domain
VSTQQATSANDWILITSEDLPTLPHVAAHILAVIGDPLCSAAQIEAIIRTDITLAQRLLRMANSALMGGTTKIVDIKNAVVRLGFNRVKNLALIAATKDLIGSAGDIAHDMWRHALGVALCTHLIAEALGKKGTDELFLGGLFHDVGQVLINNQKPARFKEIITTACAQRRMTSEVEKEVFNFSHEEVGVLILKKWGLPESLIAPVRYHHTIQHDETTQILNQEAVAITATADLIAGSLNIGLLTSATIDPINARSTQLLGLDAEQILGVAEKLPELFLDEMGKFS